MSQQANNVHARATATADVEEVIKAGGGYVWEESSEATPPGPINFDTLAADLLTKTNTAATAQAQMLEARASLAGQLKVLRETTRLFIALAKVRARGDDQRMAVLKKLVSQRDSRQGIITFAKAAHAALTSIDIGIVLHDARSLDDLNDLINDAQFEQSAYETRRVAARNAVEAERQASKSLLKLCVAWYSLLTRIYKKGTQYGDLIRAQVPSGGAGSSSGNSSGSSGGGAGSGSGGGSGTGTGGGSGAGGGSGS